MSGPLRVALFIVFSSFMDGASAGPTTPDFEAFTEGTITPHTESYDSLAAHPLIVRLQGFRGAAIHPYERRWGARVVLLGVAHHEAAGKEKAWFKRAMELALWESIQWMEGLGQPLALPDTADIPPCLNPDEVEDLLAIDRALRPMEDAQAEGGKE